ncbi:sulfatase-like hydrolase/transferase [Verrucomicrobiaceae bacterium 5K15]|uniref:Sulfatase-like hydrolase/transferase n=1 Tax=Oceaniferula flava TaxID=2800421 RepID=A0AAE2VA37_9BACT|nr:sulfatase-like hydrolase/transferase [Oceaniferula flavus]MBK1856258.1 sulfatase-like hydrolase/transferase [Oceaniferula flavus]MBM1137565.1 sulfatase-like hydrolase/transferase [Oceaniferula flavus]
MKPTFLAISLLGLTWLPSLSHAAPTPPNIVILFSDDAGYADFGFQPDCAEEMKQLTPNIDTIARDGVRLSNAYMSGCVCSPSRAGLMTGRYQERFGFDNNLPPGHKNGVDLDETFGVKRLQKLGYKTALIGKWHLGYPAEYHPNERGYDWFYGLLQGSRGYHPYKKPSPHRVILDNKKPTPEEGYITDRFGDAACQFIQENKGEPFYLFVSFTAPHSPNQPNKKDLDRIKHIKKNMRRNYAGLMVSLDDNVGKILKTIKDSGIEDNTLVIFTNDNGGQTATGANNGRLKGKKGSLWEGGVRVPWAMRWPGKIKAGTVVNDPIISLDILPTVVDLTDHPVADSWNLDGRSMLPLMTGKAASLPERTLHWRQHGPEGSISLRRGKWKLIHNRGIEGATPELYDLENDLGESKNVAAQNPELVKSLLSDMKQWESQLQDPLWGPGSPSRKSKK